ncbi:MAG: amino acid adenylation domain-containing protein, partial [Acidobacteriia bacterium]|nr:amino acid adenylation domain-containing protein [Terriglobia bacterium]
GQLTDQLKSLAERHGGTLYMVLLAAFKALLHRYTGQNDICVGSPIANRQYGETEGLIGMFVNTLALRSQVEGEDTFEGLLEQVRTTCLEAYEHQDAPFEKVVEMLQPERNLATTPIFQLMLMLQNADTGAQDQRFPRYPVQSEISKFDLTVAFAETPDGLAGSIAYSTTLYKPQTIARMARHFTTLCQAIAVIPTARICDLDFIGEPEKQRLLIDYNKASTSYHNDKCLHEVFLEQASLHASKTAMVFGENELSYQELCRRSSDLALHLQSLGVKPDSIVGLCLERSLDMVVGLLGILQAGGAYMPLDPEYPDERLAYMLQDTEAGIVLTQEKLYNKLKGFIPATTQLIAIDGQWQEISHHVATLEAKKVQLLQQVKPHHLAYVISTSGSTGRAKGVMIEHRHVMSYVTAIQNKLQIPEGSSFALVSTFAADLGNTVLFPSLLGGGTLHVLSADAVTDADCFAAYCRKNRIDCMKITPSHLHALIAERVEPCLVPAHTLIFGGEVLSREVVDLVRRLNPGCRIFNHYGPTECSVGVLSGEVTTDAQLSRHAIPLGSPLNGTRIYVLDRERQLVPTGIVGEVYIGGGQVGRGYLSRPDLTADRFIPDPFNPDAGARMYKTGDLARWLEDGNIQFLGRIDTQVKVRGYRIELGEIEACLREHVLVRQAVVAVREDAPGEKQLVAYVVPASAERQDGSAEGKTRDGSDLTATLRAHLAACLPQYMVPAAFVKLDVLPLTPNGKLDRKRLPSPNVDAYETRAYEAPVGKIETTLASIWEEVLKIQKIGRRDNFFSLGGHSLLTLRLVNSLERKGINISALDIFKHATLESLAAKVEFEGRQAPRDRAISLRSGGSEPPLFFTHDGSAQLIYVPALAPYIHPDVPLYGLPAIPAYEPQLKSIEAMAMRMVKMIRAVQPAGPYRIAGWSFGGLSAFEVAVQLVSAGEKVDFIGLIDTYYPVPRRTSVNVVQSDFDDKKELLIIFERAIQRLPDLSEEERLQKTAEIDSLAAAVDFEVLAQKCREMRLLPSRWIDLTAVQLRQTLARMHAHRIAGSQYAAPRVTVPLHLFHAQDDNTSPWLGWNTAFPESQIRVIEVPGTHLTIMEKPNVATLGQALSDAIRSATGDLNTVIEKSNAPLLPLQMGWVEKMPGLGDD